MIESIAKAIGGTIVAVILLAGALANITDTPDIEMVNKSVLARAYMDKNKDQYAKCDNSINNGLTAISNVSISYYAPGPGAAELGKKLTAAEESFKTGVEMKCRRYIDGYESNYKTLKSAETEIAKTSQSLLDKMLRNKPQLDEKAIREYEPSYVQFTSGNPFTNLIFTEDDVKAHFVAELGY